VCFCHYQLVSDGSDALHIESCYCHNATLGKITSLVYGVKECSHRHWGWLVNTCILENQSDMSSEDFLTFGWVSTSKGGKLLSSFSTQSRFVIIPWPLATGFMGDLVQELAIPSQRKVLGILSHVQEHDKFSPSLSLAGRMLDCSCVYDKIRIWVSGSLEVNTSSCWIPCGFCQRKLLQIGRFSMRLLPRAEAAYLAPIVIDLHTTLYIV
jgi:hypothetical protein